MGENQKLKMSIKNLYNLLEEYPDESTSACEFLNFLRSFLRISANPLPIKEVMTLIKENKPTVLFTLKKMSNTNMMVRILTGLSTDMDIRVAEYRLRKIIK
ncbi:hypothetical protein [Heyndrickxia acidicola]|uniref:Uncharacterized protein n=1 Tax=Heyndrickxia acidicola TaxID=209389 RepID=A0ABU6MBY9_9BACI|nr:hypothetical protein [Heyndrickxia acidicola]MED1201933.1 hypothetical protein [Heyndrickxia acidicola]